ncbi:hypothetical protein ZWY2020_038072 [Hordeum vulgare]|nr:hypothetical protein ZWY2020_038072 [Hordeum vulgare]
MTTSQALSHPWIRDAQQVKIPSDMIIYKLIRAYISSSSLWKSALREYEKEKLNERIAKLSGGVAVIQVLVNDNFRYDYNAATGKKEDLMAAGIIDPTKVVRCCLEHAASVAKTFITSDVVVVDIKESEQAPAANPMVGSGYGF